MIDKFLNPEITDKSIIFEVFPTVKDEQDALWAAHHILSDPELIKRRKMLIKKNKRKAMIKSVLPNGVIAMMKKKNIK